MAATILTATRKNTTVQGKINLRSLARLIELSKHTPNPMISEIVILGGEVDVKDPNHAKMDYFVNPWLEVMVRVEDWRTNMQYDHTNKVATIDKTVSLF